MATLFWNVALPGPHPKVLSTVVPRLVEFPSLLCLAWGRRVTPQEYPCPFPRSLLLFPATSHFLLLNEDPEFASHLGPWNLPTPSTDLFDRNLHFEGKWGINGDRWRLDLGWWTHNIIYSWCVVELYTWSLYDFINQCHPNKFNEKCPLGNQKRNNWFYHYDTLIIARARLETIQLD